MKISFYGAAKEVTGSCHCIDINGKRILIDCGLIQGHNNESNYVFPFNPEEVDFVFLTHAHIDHSGRLPLLVKRGFKGKIFSTKATCHLLKIMLIDSAHIQEMDSEWKNRKGRRAGHKIDEPLYTVTDAANCLNYLVPCAYEKEIVVEEGIVIKFIDAGHLLGSSSIKVTLTENNITKNIVFSGDIGNTNIPIIRDPSYIKDADYVVMESTYGDRNHESNVNSVEVLAKIFNKTFSRGGNVVIPSFAVGRTQELLYYIHEIKAKKLVTSLPDFHVYVDSPLATESTMIYDEEMFENADEDTLKILKSGADPIKFTNLHLCESLQESQAINGDNKPKVIISSSGMCEAGRIKHHLKHNLWRTESSIVFVGFQAEGTLGRKIVDGAKNVNIFGEEIIIKAEIHNFRGLSGHADHNGLVKWITSFDPKPQRVFIVHGESETCEKFEMSLKDIGFKTFIPKFEATYDILEDEVVSFGIDKSVFKQKVTGTPAFTRLLDSGSKLIQVIEHNKGGANRDLSKFADEIIELCSKWDR